MVSSVVQRIHSPLERGNKTPTAEEIAILTIRELQTIQQGKPYRVLTEVEKVK